MVTGCLYEPSHSPLPQLYVASKKHRANKHLVGLEIKNEEGEIGKQGHSTLTGVNSSHRDPECFREGPEEVHDTPGFHLHPQPSSYGSCQMWAPAWGNGRQILSISYLGIWRLQVEIPISYGKWMCFLSWVSLQSNSHYHHKWTSKRVLGRPAFDTLCFILFSSLSLTKHTKVEQDEVKGFPTLETCSSVKRGQRCYRLRPWAVWDVQRDWSEWDGRRN